MCYNIEQEMPQIVANIGCEPLYKLPRHRETVEPWCPYSEIPENLKTLRERRMERRA